MLFLPIGLLQNQILAQSSCLIMLQHFIRLNVRLKPYFSALVQSLALGLQAHPRIISKTLNSNTGCVDSIHCATLH